jgi:PAS domain S-box-containing protein
MYTPNPYLRFASPHVVQCYEQDARFLDNVHDYIESGLTLGESILVFATPTHADALTLTGHVTSSPRYRMWDAEQMLTQFFSTPRVDSIRFHSVMGELCQQATTRGTGRIRIFSEMMALLWEKGATAAAMQLESLWNQLALRFPLSVVCAYPTHDVSERTVSFMAQLEGQHSGLLAKLEQRTAAWEVEVARRRELERRFHQRDDELTEFFEHAAECLHQVGADGIIMWANKAELTLLGYEPQEYMGRHISAFHVDPETIDDIMKRLTRGESLYNYPARLRCKDGSVKNVLIHSNVRWDEGTVSYTRCFTRDITELKTAEAELDRRVAERTRDLLDSQQKLRTLAAELSLAEGRVRKTLAGELHDYLAQLLVVARLKLAHITREGSGDGRLLPLIADADKVINEAITYTRSLMAELNPPILEFGLVMGLKWLVDKFKVHNLHVVLVVPETLNIKISETHTAILFQCTRELLMNVVKHAETNAATIALSYDEKTISLHVSDPGKGLGPTSVPTRRTTELGLTQFGLFSIRERMEALGGRFEMRSAPNKGTQSTLILPLSELGVVASVSPALESPREGSENACGTHKGSRVRVLLVEDHAMVREGLRGILQGYPDLQVIGEAVDGEDALVQTARLAPDVVVMDVNLPKLDGISATRGIKIAHPQTIVIGLSVHQASQVEAAFKEAGGAAYVTKDAAAVSLYEAIQQAVRTVPSADASRIATDLLQKSPLDAEHDPTASGTVQ